MRDDPSRPATPGPWWNRPQPIIGALKAFADRGEAANEVRTA